MTIDPDKLLALDIPAVRQSFGWRDTVTYALGLGFGMDPLDADELRFVDETRLQAAPTMANVLAYPGFWIRDLDTGLDWLRIVHGEQSMRIIRPLPTSGTVVGKTRILDIVDKGAGRSALLFVERDVVDESTGEPLAALRQTVFCRGDGGFGGKSASPYQLEPLPEGSPNATVDVATHSQMALIYRLSGDLNPLHSDPDVARKAGYERPILHGLATFGVACRGLMRALCPGEPQRVSGLEARFSAPVYPGETISLDIWNAGDGEAAFCARVAARGATVLTNGRFHYQPRGGQA